MLLGALPKDRIDAVFSADMEKRYAGAKLLDSVKVDDDRVDNKIVVSMRFSLPKPLQYQGNTWRVAFKPENFARIFTLTQDSKRRAPVSLRYPINVRYTFATELPDEVSVAVDPITASVANRYFLSTAERSFRGNHSQTTANLMTLTDRVPASDQTLLREELQKFERGFPTVVAIGESNLKKSAFLGLGRKDFASTLKARQEDLVTRITATLKTGRLSGGDLSKAYCDRGAALYSLGRNDEAVADGDHAVEVDPNVPASLVCRSEILLATGQFAKAVDDASNAIVLGAEGAVAYHVRGQARFHLARYRDAADDFAKAGSIDATERTTLYNDLWRALAFRRMKQDLPDDLRKRAGAEVRGPWPRPALALLADQLGPDDLHALAASKPGDEAEMNQTEADFYLGEYYLSTGDTEKARNAFKASRARGVIVYAEYLASGFELERMAK